MQRIAKNSSVMILAAGAALALVHTQTNWLSSDEKPIERERCYGVTSVRGNDCATPKHSCAMQASRARDPAEWLMVPKGLCDKIAGGVTETL